MYRTRRTPRVGVSRAASTSHRPATTLHPKSAGNVGLLHDGSDAFSLLYYSQA